MARKEETIFRMMKVLPFLRRLEHSYYFPIQQLAVVGDPDYVLCCRGRFIALELKKSGGLPRPIQEAKLKRVREAEGLTFVASPDNWEIVKDAISRLDRGTK